MEDRNSIKLCVLTEFFYPDCQSGTGKAVSDIARILTDDYGYQVSVQCSALAYKSDRRLPNEDSWNGIAIRRFGHPNWNHKGVLRRTFCNLMLTARVAWRLVTGPKYDLVLVTTAPPFMPMAAKAAKRLRRIPYAYLIYDLEPDRTTRLGVISPSNPTAKALGYAQRRWLQGAAGVVAIGRCMKKLLITKYGVSPEKTHVIPVGSEEKQSAVRFERPGPFSKEHPFRLLYSGNLGRYHDFDALLDCAKALQSEPFSFKIVGNGAKRKHLEMRVRDEKIANVTIMDPVSSDEYVQLLAKADACFVTMEDGIEGTCVPSKFYSILAAGRPTLAVAREASELAMCIKEHDCGKVVPPGDSHALTEALRSMLAMGEQVDELGANGRRAFVENYTIQDSVASYHCVFTSILKQKARVNLPLDDSNVRAKDEVSDRRKLAEEALVKRSRAKV